jgi:hypothetical protein
LAGINERDYVGGVYRDVPFMDEGVGRELSLPTTEKAAQAAFSFIDTLATVRVKFAMLARLLLLLNLSS